MVPFSVFAKTMNRREMLGSIVGGTAVSLLAAPAEMSGREPPSQGKLGIVTYALGILQRAGDAGDLADPVTFLDHCHRLGAGGIQVPLGIREEAYAVRLRKQAEAKGMFIEGIAGLPRDRAGVERFEAAIRTAVQAAAGAVRVVIIPGRRYERFDSAGQFRQFARQGVKSLELAEPVAARHRMPLAVENHKDQRIGERVELLKHIGSRYVGTCVDVGNSFALLEDPLEAVEAYAPWAFSVHLKDQAVRPCRDGFLLADVPLGEGFLDLPRMVELLRKAKPGIRFGLEVITRDPLTVPCLTEKYWATMPEVPGRDLARTLRTVRANAASKPLPKVGHLPLRQQVELEAETVRKSLAYAGEHLGL